MYLTSRFSTGRLIVIVAILSAVVCVPLVYSRNNRKQTQGLSGPLTRELTVRSGGIQTNSIDRQGQLSESGRQQIAALLAEKETRTPVQQKIDSQLLQAVRESRGQQMVAGVNLLHPDVKASDTGMLAVDISAKVSDDLLARIQNLGGQIIYPSVQYNTIRAQINISTVESIAAFSDVNFIQPAVEAYTNKAPADPEPPVLKSFRRPSFAERAEKVRTALSGYLANTNAAKTASPMFTGTITSEGDRTHRSDDVRSTFGYAGEGVRIGVLSDSFNSTNQQASLVFGGNLPGPGNPFGNLTPVTVVQDFTTGGTDEGQEMLQIVHDIAPRAQLFFATANISEASFASNILALRNAPNNCDIIIDDVGYFDEPAFQDGILAQAVNTVTASGGLYFSSAGNEGSVAKNTAGVWEGDFTDAGSTLVVPGTGKSGTVLNFGTVGSPIQGNTITALGSAYTLGWSDPLGASNNDYDLFLMDSTLTTVKAFSTNIQNGTQDPFERISGQISVGDKLVVFKSSGAAVRAVRLNTFRGTLAVATVGQTDGHSAAVDAFSVAAAPAAKRFNSVSPAGPFPGAFSSGNLLEKFSSDGPRRMFYNADGTAITPGNVLFGTNGGTVRNKPDLTAADGVTIQGMFNLIPFFGTSAAAPHAGAIAALLKSANPSLTPQQIRTALISTALDIESPGSDINSGAGIIQAFQAMQSIQPNPELHLSLGTVNATEAEFSNHNGFLDPGEVGNAVVTLNNPSQIDATNVKATLVNAFGSSVTVLQNTASYGTIPASGSSTNTGTPFKFAISKNLPCGLQIPLFLVVTFDGVSSPQQFTVPINTGKPIAPITASLGQPQSGTGFTSATGTQTGILARNGVSTACGGTFTNPGLAVATGARKFDSYTFSNLSGGQCITVTLNSPNGANLYVAAYNFVGFDPANPAGSGLVGTAGSSGTQQTFSFNALTSAFTIVVHEVDPGSGVGSPYTLNISLRTCSGDQSPTCSPITVLPSPLPDGATGVPYNPVTLTSVGGSGFTTPTVASSNVLPTGMIRSGNTISGTPTQPGIFTIRTDVQDAICPTTAVFSNLTIAGDFADTINTDFGDNQSASPGTAFPGALRVIVRDRNNKPLQGVAVTFQLPDQSGPSATFAGSNTSVTDFNGRASSPIPTANNISGSYVVRAVINNNLKADFHLSNSCSGVVTNIADNGPGSLRSVIQNACENATITFSSTVNSEITLTSGEIVINKSLFIQGGDSRTSIPISSNHNSRIFTIVTPGQATKPTEVTLSHFTIRNGSPSGTDTPGGGGGVLVLGSSTLNLIESMLTDNSVSAAPVTSGGGIEVQSSQLNILRSSIINNTAGSGGGGGIHLGGTASANITNTTISGNVTGPTGKGGGIEVDTQQANCVSNSVISYSTVFGNSANSGGNFSSSDVSACVTINNSIFAGGILVGSSPSKPDLNGGFVSDGFNLIQTTSPEISTILKPTDITGSDPLLLPLSFIDTSQERITRWMLPLPASPVINAGAPAKLADKDQRGFLRRPTGNSDIGAVGTAYTLSIVGGTPQTTVVNTPFTSRLSAAVSESGTQVNGVPVTFTSPAVGAGALFAGSNIATVVTTNGGVLSPAISANAIAGSYVVTGKISESIPSVAYNLTNVPPISSIAVFAGSPQSATLGARFSIPFQAIVRDINNAPIPGFTVTFSAPVNSSSDPSGRFGDFSIGQGSPTATVITDSNGIATAPVFGGINNIGSYAVTASVVGNVPPASFNLTNLPQNISLKAGTPQFAVVGTQFSSSLQAIITDSNNAPVPQSIVTFSAPTSGPSGRFPGNVTSTSVTALSSGIAVVPFTANNIPGTYTVTGSVIGGATVSFTLTNIPPPASVTATGGTPQSAVIGTTFPGLLRATVRDASNNPIQGINVTFTAPIFIINSTNPSGIFPGNVTAVTVVTDSSGVATAPAFTANSNAGAYSVIASIGFGVPNASFALTNIPPPAIVSPTAGTPQSALLGAAFATALQATVRDSSFNPSPGINVTFTAPGSGPSGTFSGGALSVTVVTNANGVATAPAFKANNLAGGYTVTADVGGGVPVAVFNLTNLQVTGTILATAGTPQNAPPGTTFQTALKATVRDTNNNLLQGINVTFTAPDNGASGTFPGGMTSATVVTDIAGVATAPSFTANGVSGTYVVTASVGGNVVPASFSLRNILPGPPASFAATAGTPQTVTIGCDFLTTLRATVLDASSVPVGGITVTFTVNPNGNSSATFVGSTIVGTAITDNNGIANAPILTANEFAGNYTVTASISELPDTLTYNLTNRIKFGDLTGEGIVNVQDLLVMANILAGNIHPTTGRKMMADVFQDAGHQVNVQDLFTMANFLAGNISTLPVVPLVQNAKMTPDSIASVTEFSSDWSDILKRPELQTVDANRTNAGFAIDLYSPETRFRISDLHWQSPGFWIRLFTESQKKDLNRLWSRS